MRKYIYIAITLPVVVFLFQQVRTHTPPGAGIEEPGVVIRGRTIGVEIADEMREQIAGLSGRESLCPDCGMLFVFPDKQVRHFWMKNMNFPLDIIWIGDGKILNISENLSPEGESPEKIYTSTLPANYVLEVNAGFAERHGIKVGDGIEYKLSD